MMSPGSAFDDLRRALRDAGTSANGKETSEVRSVRVDPRRWERTGIPEVVLADSKPVEIILDAMRRLASVQQRVLASRVRADDVDLIRGELEPDLAVTTYPRARSLVAAVPGAVRPTTGGIVGILSAGSSDIPVASEAGLIAAEMGATVLEAWDVGVAGLHRLVAPLEQFVAAGVDVIVVAAGMDGVLPGVVAGLVDVPVIGLPVSTGYGLGGAGIGALTTMLQSCAPGLAVVNVDNGIGAGSTAALIANRAAASRHAEGVDSGKEETDRLVR